LTWLTARHVKPLYDAIRVRWRRLRDAGIAAPIDDAVFHYVLVGAASLPYVNAPEARLLTGEEPTDPDWVEAHADGLVATLLPNRGAATRCRPAPGRATAATEPSVTPAAGRHLETQVLVIGGGPVGLSTALQSRRAGHRLRPRRSATRRRPTHPKASYFNVRTMELLRRLGIADAVYATALFPQGVSFYTRLRGHKLGC